MPSASTEAGLDPAQPACPDFRERGRGTGNGGQRGLSVRMQAGSSSGDCAEDREHRDNQRFEYNVRL